MTEKKRKPSFSLKKLLGLLPASHSDKALSSYISIIKPEIKDRDEFKRRYTVCEITTPDIAPDDRQKTESPYSHRRKAIAILSQDPDVISTCNALGDINEWSPTMNRTFILIRNNGYPFVSEKIKRIQSKVFEHVIVTMLDEDELFDNDELQLLPVKLLFNAMFREQQTSINKLDSDTITNLMSDFIIFNPAWSVIDRETGQYRSLYGVKIKISQRGELDAGVVTFSNKAAFIEKFSWNKDAVETAHKLTRYELTSNPIGLAPASSSTTDDEKIFIQRSLTPNKKNCVPECMFGSLQSFCNSKQGLVAQTLYMFNELYGDMMTVELEKVRIENCIETKTINDRKNDQLAYFNEQLKNYHDFCIINRLEQYDENNEHVASLVRSIEEALRISPESIRYAAAPQPGCLNIIIDHDKEHYDRIKESAVVDKYTLDIQKEDTPVIQHITVETLRTLTKHRKDESDQKIAYIPDYLVFVLYNECIVKGDILKRRLSIPWERDYGYDITFAKRFVFLSPSPDDPERFEKKEKFLSMAIRRNGEFSLDSEDVKDLSPANPLSRALIQLKNDDVAVYQDGRLAIISKAPFKVFNDFDGIEKYGEEYGLKGLDSRNLFFAGTFELRSFRFNGETYLISGMHKDQIGRENIINKGVIPRKLTYLSENTSGMEYMLLSQMNNVYVSRDKISAYPFPAKYLNEWAKMLAVTAKETVLSTDSEDGIAQETVRDGREGVLPGFEQFISSHEEQLPRNKMVGFVPQTKEQRQELERLAAEDKGGNMSKLLREICTLGLEAYAAARPGKSHRS